MIRSAGAVLALLSLSACANSPALADPQIVVSPYYAAYGLSGRTNLQTPGTPPTDNQSVGLDQFGQGKLDSDVGLRVDIGDGLTGLRADYFRLDSRSSRRGTLADDWGAVQQGDVAGLVARMDELRLSFAYELLAHKAELRYGSKLGLHFAPALVFALHDAKLRGFDDGKTRMSVQKVDDKGVVYPAARARVTWRDFALDGEYAWSDGFTLGGDFTGTQQDLEFRLSWKAPTNDVGVFAGWRRASYGMEGNSDGLHFQDDLVLQGFQVGITVTL